jgi:hypothetical protein
MSLLYEYSGNLHMHTPYSDGEAYHAEIARAALTAGLDFIIVTDHNVLVQGVEGYYTDHENHVLLLTGEEIHDRTRLPQVNHLLVYGAERELATCASDPQGLINAVNAAGGLCFLAHPHDTPLERLNEPAIPWEDWHVLGFTGLEIWNYMSSVKQVINEGSLWQAIRAAFRPEEAISAPNPLTFAKWDALLSAGQRVVGIGNSDAHGTVFQLGLLKHTVFPYDFLFSCVNTHILSAQPFNGDWQHDKAIVYKALRQGHAYIGYDLLGSTRQFRFSAHGQHGTAIMGDSLKLGSGVTLQALAGARSHIKLIRHGKVVAEAHNRENLTYTAQQGGAYRVEVWRTFKGRPRAWILSNPIYLEDAAYRLNHA